MGMLSEYELVGERAIMTGGSDTSRVSVERRYRSIVEDMTDFVVRWLPDGTRTFVNEPYLRCFGLTREEAIGTTFLPQVHERDRDLLELKLASLTPKRPVAENVQRVLRGDDTIGWQHWVDRAFFDDDGNIVELQSVGRDVTEWKEGEAALRESEARFRALCRHAPIGIFLDDPDGKAVYVNQRYGEIVGIDAEQALLDGWLRNIHPEDRLLVDQAWGDALASRSSVETTYRFRRPDGEVRWVDGRAAPVVDDEDRFLGFVGTLLDVTKERESRNQLRASEERFRALCQHAPVGIFLNDLDGACAYVNESGRRIAGLSPDATSADWRNRIHPDEREEVEAACARAIETRTPFGRVVRFLHSDGSERWAQVTAAATRDDSGRMTGYVGCIVEITDRIQAEERSEKRLEFKRLLARLSAEFIDARPDEEAYLYLRGLAAVCAYADAKVAGLYEFDETGTRTRLARQYVSEKRARYGPNPTDFEEWRPIAEMRMTWSWDRIREGRTVFIRHRGDFPLPAAAPDLAYLDEWQRTRAEGLSPAGSEWNGCLVHTPLTVRDRVIGCLFVNEDDGPTRWSDEFVEQMQLVARLFASALHRRETERRLAEQQTLMTHVGRVTVAGELSAGIAHEISQPLFAILNCARAIQNAIASGGDRPDLELLADAAAEIGRSSERAGELVRRLRDFVRRVEPERTPCSVAQLVADSLALVEYEVHRTETRIDVDIPSNLPEVSADAVQVEQVLINLVRNAIEAMVEANRDRRITISASMGDGVVIMSVLDSGPGFDPEAGDPFESFVTSKETGMGVGLAISRKIVDSHGGCLWIDRGMDEGGCVRFSLPLAGHT